MNSEEFRTLLLSKRPRYANSKIPVIQALANKGNKNSEYNQFGPIYELYIFAFVLALKKNMTLDLPPRNLTTDFLELGKWKRDSKLVDFLLMIVFTRSEEIGFTWNELEDMEEKEINDAVSNIISFIESYANAGLEFLQKEWEQDNLINSHYLFVDLLAEYSTFIEDNDESEEKLNILKASDDIIESTKACIKLGESSNTEFKSTLRVNLHTNNPDPKMELSCMKTIAGFMNTNGGTLLIGVSDNKDVLGLNADFESFGNKPDPMDEFQKHLDNLFENYFGNSAFSLMEIYFLEIDGKVICRIDTLRSSKRHMILKNKSKGNTQEFYIRRSASTKALEAEEMINYIENHWG